MAGEWERNNSMSPVAHLLKADKAYTAHDVIDETSKTALVGLGSGIFIAALRNALSRKNVGAWSVFTRGAPLIGLATTAPTVYCFVSRTSMNLREKEDLWSVALGGFAGGSVLGLPSKKFGTPLALGTAFSIFAGTFFLFGNRLDSFKNEEDEFERKETLRRTRRAPVEQTVKDLGEGRGIKPPGYEERRRERIKEKYGFEIDPVKATVDGSE